MKIGISGASGHFGSSAIRELKQRTAAGNIVAISRSPEKLKSESVEARFGDYDQPGSLIEAYKGFDCLLIIPTSDMRPGQRTIQNVAAIDAAVAAGAEHIVFLSAGGTRNVAAPSNGASYFAGEQRLIKTAKKWTILRMSYYSESFAQEAMTSLQHGVLTGIAENRVSFVSREDLAAAAAGMLTTDGHNGAIYSLTGPHALSGAERATIVSNVSGKTVNFITIPAEDLERQMIQVGLPPEIARVVIDIQRGFVNGDFNIVTGDIEKLSGKKPRTLEDVLATFLNKKS